MLSCWRYRFDSGFLSVCCVMRRTERRVYHRRFDSEREEVSRQHVEDDTHLDVRHE